MDRLQLLPPDSAKLRGYLGDRVEKNEKNRLLLVDEDALLVGFRKRPGSQAWIGEHVGKWLHAATLAWANSGDPALRTKLDRVVIELLKTQEPDGYLGTYTPDKRFGLHQGADWDVWVHKYNLIGLLTYHRYTRSAPALQAARRIGDLLLNTFGPGKKSIISAGTHVGMASTSVLEPVIELYRATEDARYLDFARTIVRSWDEPGGPAVQAALLTKKAVQHTANAKAYEMLSNLVGLCELARVTGDAKLAEPALIAWDDIVKNHLYITGSASHHEHFHAPHELPNHPSANVGETCVTVTWIQLNAQLLRLTGEARFGDEMERAYYNHLMGAQDPDGTKWAYYTALEGIKPYGPGINCCVSSGPRGMALAPLLTYLKYREDGSDGIAVNLFESSTVTAEMDGQKVTIEQASEFPPAGLTTLKVRTPGRARFGLKVRVPAWAEPLKMEPGLGARIEAGWAVIPPRRWKDGEQVKVRFRAPARLVLGAHGNRGKAALTWGPLVLAYDSAKNPGFPPPGLMGLADPGAGSPVRLASRPGEPLAFQADVTWANQPAPRPAVFVPFADAGRTGDRYQVWLTAPGEPLAKNDSLFAFAAETRSRPGNATGSITDGDLSSFVVTFNNRPRVQDFFAVHSDVPVTVRRVIFTHDKVFHDGGWFDTSAGKPRVQVQRVKDGPWETVGTLADYPATTATDHAGLKEGQQFTLRLPRPESVVSVRVAGKPAHGDNPAQAFASCAELQALAD